MTLTLRLARLMRRWADRLDYPGAPKCTGYSFTFEHEQGIRFRDDGRGCPLWYLGDADYERAHTEADASMGRWRATLQASREGGQL